jgi:hypothetical protein
VSASEDAWTEIWLADRCAYISALDLAPREISELSRHAGSLTVVCAAEDWCFETVVRLRDQAALSHTSCRIDVYSTSMGADDIERLLSMPSWNVFRKERTFDTDGEVLRPSRWRMRPDLVRERAEEAGSAIRMGCAMASKVAALIEQSRDDTWVRITFYGERKEGELLVCMDLERDVMDTLKKSKVWVNCRFVLP